MACQCAWAAARTKNTYLSAKFRRVAARRGSKRAIIAVAHSLGIIGYYLQKSQRNYEDLGGDYFDRIDSDGLKRYFISGLGKLVPKSTLVPIKAAYPTASHQCFPARPPLSFALRSAPNHHHP